MYYVSNQTIRLEWHAINIIMRVCNLIFDLISENSFRLERKKLFCCSKLKETFVLTSKNCFELKFINILLHVMSQIVKIEFTFIVKRHI